MKYTNNSSLAPFTQRTFESYGANIWYQIILSSLIVASTAMNTLVLVHYFYNRRNIERNLLIKKCLVASLAISDMLQSTIGYSLQLSSVSYQFHPKICQLSGFTIAFFAFASINHIVLISIESYVHICHPWLKQKLNLSRGAVEVIFIIIALIYAFFWAAYPLFRWNDFGTLIMNACTINWYTSDNAHKQFILGLFIMCIVVPIAVMTSCNILCQRTLHHMRIYAEEHFGTNSNATIENARAETKALQLGLIMAAAFCIAWLPYSVLGLTQVFGIPLSTNYLQTFGEFSSIAAKTSCILNPIIYTVCQKTFREDILKLLPKAWCTSEDRQQSTYGHPSEDHMEQAV